MSEIVVATYDVAETAKILGCGTYTVRQMIKEGKIPHLQLGRLIRVPKAAIDRLLEGRP